MVAGASTAAARAGVGVVISQTYGRKVGNRHWIRQLASRRTDGIVLVVSHLMPGTAEDLARLNTPLVLVDPVGDASVSLPSVAATNRAGGIAATEHLLALGHRRIAIVTGPADDKCSVEQARGTYLAAEAAGHRIPEDLSVVGFDDVALCEWVSPTLTRVRQPLAAMAAEAITLVLALSANDEPPLPLRRELPTRLVVRESTAPPRSQ